MATDEEGRRYRAKLYLHHNAGIQRDLLSLEIKCLDVEPGVQGSFSYERYQIDGCLLMPDGDTPGAPIQIPPELVPE